MTCQAAPSKRRRPSTETAQRTQYHLTGTGHEFCNCQPGCTCNFSGFPTSADAEFCDDGDWADLGPGTARLEALAPGRYQVSVGCEGALELEEVRAELTGVVVEGPDGERVELGEHLSRPDGIPQIDEATDDLAADADLVVDTGRTHLLDPGDHGIFDEPELGEDLRHPSAFDCRRSGGDVRLHAVFREGSHLLRLERHAGCARHRSRTAP